MLSHSAVIEGWSDEETLAGLKARKGPPDAQRALFANELRNSGGDLSQSLAAPASLAAALSKSSRLTPTLATSSR